MSNSTYTTSLLMPAKDISDRGAVQFSEIRLKFPYVHIHNSQAAG